MGIDPKKAIENDVYHFSRLGFDLYRVHVWDTEISDALGNLIANEHLDTFDFLMKKLAEKGIRSVITPSLFGEMAGRNPMKTHLVFPINKAMTTVLQALLPLRRSKITCFNF